MTVAHNPLSVAPSLLSRNSSQSAVGQSSDQTAAQTFRQLHRVTSSNQTPLFATRTHLFHVYTATRPAAPARYQ